MRGKFGLKRVLEVRRIREQVGQQRLAEAAAEVAREHARLEEIERHYRLGQQRIEHELSRPVLALILVESHQYALALERRRSGQEQTVAMATDRLKGRQEELSELWRQREIMSRLERQYLMRSRREASRREQATLDDMAAQASVRQGGV